MTNIKENQKYKDCEGFIWEVLHVYTKKCIPVQADIVCDDLVGSQHRIDVESLIKECELLQS